jgi:hypothetical protein
MRSFARGTKAVHYKLIIAREREAYFCSYRNMPGIFLCVHRVNKFYVLTPESYQTRRCKIGVRNDTQIASHSDD